LSSQQFFFFFFDAKLQIQILCGAWFWLPNAKCQVPSRHSPLTNKTKQQTMFIVLFLLGAQPSQQQVLISEYNALMQIYDHSGAMLVAVDRG
jgi:hypothetical protein